jgi:S-DNA-T family DNA segregation ATPase FtsK/SpoIIIE
MHAVPVEGVVGRLMAGLLVGYLNLQGAWLVAGVMAATGLYFASAVSFSVIAEGVQDRWRNWREERAEQREMREGELGRPESNKAFLGQA